MDVDWKSFKLSFINELSDNDMDKRHLAWEPLLDLIRTIPKGGKVFSSEECAIYRSGQVRNVYFGSKENPKKCEQNPSRVITWAIIWSKFLIEPCLFEVSVNHHSYLALLRECFVS